MARIWTRTSFFGAPTCVPRPEGGVRPGRFLPVWRRLAGDFAHIVFLHAVVLQGAKAAYHGHAGAAFVFHGIDQADDAHLTSQLYVGRAAGTDIVSGNLHNTHLSAQFLFAAVIQLVQFLFGRIGDNDWKVFHYCLVGFVFYLPELFWCEGAVKIHGHQLLAQMKSYIIVSEGAVHNAETMCSPVCCCILEKRSL